jgi:hypothetical protein
MADYSVVRSDGFVLGTAMVSDVALSFAQYQRTHGGGRDLSLLVDGKVKYTPEELMQFLDGLYGPTK